MKATLDHVDELTEIIRTFWFKPERPIPYTAGQFTELTLHHKNVDDRGEKRWFTISSAPGEDLVSITTKRTLENGSTFKKALWGLRPGHEVSLEDAMGDFVMPKLIQTPLIFVAGGIGITPFHSMAAWLRESKETRPIRLLYAVQTEDDIVFAETFETVGIDPTVVVSKPSNAWGGVRGHLDAELILGLKKPTDDTLIFLSGPEPMLEALTNELKKSGVNNRQLVTDYFPGYTSL